MQHGSLLLGPGHERLAELVPGRGGQVARQLTVGSTDLGRCLDVTVDTQRVRVALASGFAEGLGVDLQASGLDAAERGRVQEAAAAKRRELEPQEVLAR